MAKFLVFLTLCLAGCAASVPRDLDSVRVGMDKDRVLEVVGNPNHTYRAEQADHWVYTYFNGDHEMRREIIFDEGKVVKISHPLAREDWVKELERTGSMEEYEQKVREHQNQKKSGTSGEGK
jgi:hypothetical protein